MATGKRIIQIPDQFRSGQTYGNIMSTIQTSTKPTVIVVPFEDHARAIVKGWATYDKQAGKAREKLTSIVNREIQAGIDAWLIAGNDRGQASCNALGKSIRDAQAFIDIVAAGAMDKKTFTEYAQGAMRALHYDVPFTADLKNDASKKLPWSKSKESTTAKNGKVSTTTRAELDKTLTKALAMARTLGLLEFAADLVDLCTDSLDDFKETVNQ